MDIVEEFKKLDLPKSFAIGLGVAGLYWVLVFDSGKSLQAQIDVASKEIAKNRTSLERVRKALDDKNKFQAEIKDINLNMKDFQRYFAPDMDINKLLSQVSTFAEKHGLTVNRLKPKERQSEFEKFEETSVEFEVEGVFHNVMEFVSSLTKMEKAIDFSKMEFETTVRGDYPQVKLKTVLVVYTSSEDIGKGKVDKETGA